MHRGGLKKTADRTPRLYWYDMIAARLARFFILMKGSMAQI
jgi:hypothetical protein